MSEAEDQEMMSVEDEGILLDEGEIPFSIESRIVRELGERLVKRPEVALLELIKNAHDADATTCTVDYDYPTSIIISDDGHGMTFDQFAHGWMRIGTSSKEQVRASDDYGRTVTGEKGIGRFSVRYLGRRLVLESVAHDEVRGFKTILEAVFDWPAFDKNEDLGKLTVPYTLKRAPNRRATGTTLVVTELRKPAANVDFRQVKTASMGNVSPHRYLLRRAGEKRVSAATRKKQDPGFSLLLRRNGLADGDDADVSSTLLNNFVLRADIALDGNKLSLQIFRRGEDEPWLNIRDRYPNKVGKLFGDIRFFPRRKGTFTGIDVDGRLATTWVKDYGGVAVFDRDFRVYPYGDKHDDWLRLAADTSRNARNAASTIAEKHFPMPPEVQNSTQLNYMLRLPYPTQIIGAVRVESTKASEQGADGTGLIASADREGFVENETFRELWDVVRGALEAIAYADRELQLEQEKQEQLEIVESLRLEAQRAIAEVQANANLSRADKNRLVKRFAAAEELAEQHETLSKRRESTLETMAMLGIVAGFMTHEFGSAMDDLESAHRTLQELASKSPAMAAHAEKLSTHIASLREFVTYSQGYVKGTANLPQKPYPAKPRVTQVKRVFGKFADERDIDVDVEIDADVMAPFVPVSLYNGVALNLYTNALKAVTAKSSRERGHIVFRAWNDGRWHFLEVSDTGVGIPTSLRKRVFDPLFTTTDVEQGPLGSGMGLGLTLIKRGIESFGGKIVVVEPPPGFATCFQVKLPLNYND
ncbi:ATP-binding protein [Burkholderia pseudomallei]|uniref:sensor histidine kinase n=1 Tax=Burkholderia pseudomallei TaxID=28450 RepID=UPI00126A5F70|nr:ATP-binding protein [Burkholderia pseudomallei]